MFCLCGTQQVLCIFALFRFTPVLEERQLIGGDVTQLFDLKRILVQRVRGEIDADEVFLFVKTLNRIPTRYLRQVGVLHFDGGVQIAEERVGVILLVRLPFIAVVHQQVQTRIAVCIGAKELLAVDVFEAFESTRLREVLNRLAVATL